MNTISKGRSHLDMRITAAKNRGRRIQPELNIIIEQQEVNEVTEHQIPLLMKAVKTLPASVVASDM